MSNSTRGCKTANKSEITRSADLDLLGTSCPMAFVKTRIYLDAKASGDAVTILYEDTTANEPLVRSIKALGHTVIERLIHSQSDNTDLNKTLPLVTVKIQVNK